MKGFKRLKKKVKIIKYNSIIKYNDNIIKYNNNGSHFIKLLEDYEL